MRQLKISQQITQRDEISVNRYFLEVNRYELISAEEEVELSVRIRKGDDIALQKLVEANLRFVISVAKQYQNQGLSFADLINEGNVGLVKAARKFDETRGFKFISYAVWWIRQSIIQAISEQTRVVRLPMNRLSTMSKVSKATSYLEQKFEREPTNKELAEYLEIEEDLITENNKLRIRQQSLDKPLTSDGDGGLCLYDLIENKDFPSPDSELVYDSVKLDLFRAISTLNKREACIINLSFGLNNNKIHSLDEIADLLNITSERIRQLRSSGLLKLRTVMSGKDSFYDNL